MVDKICELPSGYKPSENEKFMNDFQREYFRRKLVHWREKLAQNAEDVVEYLQQEDMTFTDIADRATSEEDLRYELRSKERAAKLINKIDEALARIQDKTYGYCAETGEPISLQRLEARPVATLSIEAQKRHEQQEKFGKIAKNG